MRVCTTIQDECCETWKRHLTISFLGPWGGRSMSTEFGALYLKAIWWLHKQSRTLLSLASIRLDLFFLCTLEFHKATFCYWSCFSLAKVSEGALCEADDRLLQVLSYGSRPEKMSLLSSVQKRVAVLSGGVQEGCYLWVRGILSWWRINKSVQCQSNVDAAMFVGVKTKIMQKSKLLIY